MSACALCGRDPAAGLASIGDYRFCHGDADELPTCYMQAQSRSSLNDHNALVRGEMTVEEYIRRLKVRVNARLSQGAPW